MKIKVEFTLDVDQALWAIENDICPRDVRQDVRDYFVYKCTTKLRKLGLEQKAKKDTGLNFS